MSKFYNVAERTNNRFTKRLFFAILCCLGIFGSVNAQVSVTASAGVLGPTAYTTVKGAFDAINAGTHQGAINVTVTGTSTETAMAVLNGSGAPSSYTSVSLRPTAPGAVITGNLGSAIIKLNGADNVTIDGFVGAGPARDLSIRNTNTGTGTGVVWVASASITDGANNNIIRNTIVTGNGATTTLVAIAQSSGTTLGDLAETNNSNNSYDNNLVTAAQYGIGVVGASATEDVNTVISRNTVNTLGHVGVFLSFQKDVVVSGNTISGVSSTLGGLAFQTSGIFIGGTMTRGLIEKNSISNIKIAGFWGCNGIQLSASNTGIDMVIANNFIYDVAAGGFSSFDSIDDNGCGIAVENGGGYKIQFNSIDLSTNQGSGITAAFWIDGGLSAGAVELRNNIISNRQTVGTRYAIYSNTANTVFSIINYNDYFSTGSVGFLTSGRVSLANWQSASGQDANSVSVDPFFTNTTNLHLLGNSPLNALATPIAGITSDIDGDVRNATTPDIGADEFTPPNCAGSLGGTIVATTVDICASGSAILSSSGYSFGLGISYQWEQSPNGVGGWANVGVGQTNPLSGNTGVILVTTYYRLKVSCTFTASTGYSNVLQIAVNNPAVSGATGASRCGVGTVNLTAVGTNLKWYTTATGGTSIGSGSPFTTPLLTNIGVTNFYVSASSGTTNISAGKPNTAGSDGGYTGTDAGLVFDATLPFTLASVTMYPQATGSITIQLVDNTGALIAQQPVTFTTTGLNVVPLGFNVPVGNNHRLVISSNPSSITIWRDFSGFTFPYNIGTVGSITNGYLGFPIGTYYFFYDWQVAISCESTRTPVAATVTAPPVFTSVSPAAGAPRIICAGNSVTLNAVGGGYTTYTWNPGAIANNSSVSPLVTTSYTLTADIPGGCRRDSVVTITVNAAPTALSITPASASVCPATPTAIAAVGGLIPGQSVFTELAETFPLTQFTQTGSGVILGQSTTYFQQGSSSIRLTHGDNSDGSIETGNIALTGFTNPSLSFYQIAGLEANLTSHYDVGTIEYSINGGANWTPFPASTYTGAGALVNGVVAFDNTSYTDWDAQFSSTASTPGIAPATSMWKQETINLSAWAGAPTFKIRFRITTDGSLQYYGWLIDNIKLIATGQAPITWSPATNLFSDPAGTVAYVLGQNFGTVYFNPSGAVAPVVYTATATSGVSCTKTATTTLSASSLSASVTISSAVPSGTICSGTSVTFTASPVNGGAPPGYNWKVNGISVSGGSQVGLNVFTIPNLANGDLVTVDMSVNPNVGACIVATVVSSPPIVMSVNPTPTANPITGGTTVCNGTPTVLTETPTGAVSTYQWLLNGAPVGINSSTFSATLPGTYTVAIASGFGCKDTSAPLIVTLPAYIITATAGANGTISPSGAVSVNCGDNQTFTITPNPGYAILDVLVDGVSQGAIGTYTFTNVTAIHSISATFFITGCATPATANAGADFAICAGSNYTLGGSYTNAPSASWVTLGTGTFNPSNVFGTALTYTPSALDITNGTVKIVLNTGAPVLPCLASTDTLILTINPAPVVTITGQIGICAAGAISTYLVADTSATTVNITTFQWFNGATPVGTNNDSLLVNATGNYSVIVSGGGCTGTDAVVVNVLTAPSVSLPLSLPSICTNSTVDINATAIAGSGVVLPNGYKWYRNAVLIVGAVTSSFSATLPGNYTVTATNSNGCVSPLSNIVTLTADTSPLNGNYTIGAGIPSCTNYVSFASAISDLNTRSISGIVRFTVDGGYTETAPVGGLILGSARLNDSTATGKTITFQKGAAGANPLITAAFTAAGNLPSSNNPDGIFRLRGVDNVSIIQIDLKENPLNIANALMEYGYGIFRYSATDGAQNNTIQNCTITLSKNNEVSGSPSTSNGATGIFLSYVVDSSAQALITPTSVAGANSFNKFYGNTIENCHTGICLIGYTAPSPFTFADYGNEIGGLNAASGNNILNFGSIPNSSSPIGIRLITQYNPTVSFNTINNNNGAGVNTTNILKGISIQAASQAGATINNNTIILNSAATTNNTFGIDNNLGSGGVTNVVNINNNDITGSSTFGTAVGANFIGIQNTATPNTLNISGNTIHDITLTGPGPFTGIINSAVVPILTINGNTVSNNIKSGTGTMTGISVGAPTSANVINNLVTDNQINGGGANCILNCITASGGTYVLDGNTIYNNSIINMTGSSLGSLYGFVNSSSAVSETFTNNIVRKLFVSGTSNGLHLIRGISNLNSAGAIRSYRRNQIDTLYSGLGSSAAITGIWSQTGSLINIGNNKIHSLFPGQNGAGLSFAKAISVNSPIGSVVNVFNNMINLDLTRALAPLPLNNNVLVGDTAITGIKVVGTANNTVNLYYNTIRLAGGGSGAGFGSSGISINSTAGTVDMRNNIISNIMTPGGSATGVCVAFRKPAVATANYAATSNNNLYYVKAGNAIYYTTIPYFTLGTFVAAVAPSRDISSIADYPVFVDSTNNDLHLQPGNNCGIDGAGQPIINYNDDYDAVGVRDPNAPDIGADEFDGTGGSGTWKGVNTNWMDARNWCGVVPTVTTDVIIPTGKSQYPVITTLAPVARNITIGTGASITINSTGQLANKGSWLNNGTITNSGIIELNGTSNQVFPNVAGTGTLASMTSLTVNNAAGATIDKSITILGTLQPTAGPITINNGVVVTIHSDLSGTARVGTLGGTASFNYVGTGKFSVERYISSATKTGWRFLSAPIGGSETIRQAWMEGQAPYSYTSTGFGMQILGPGGIPQGFDSLTINPSLKTYNPATGAWVSVTGTNIPISTTEGYMAFIRGDRGSRYFGNMSPTTLRMSGPIKTGTVGPLSTAVANGFISVGNPYPSAIDFTTTTRVGMQNTYYLWDPKLGTYGGYQVFVGPGYVASPGGGSYGGGNKFIESGQAFFAVATAGAPPHNITLNESNKVDGSFQVARTAGFEKQLSTRLYAVNAGNASLFDGVRVDFDGSYSNTIDDNDAPKLSNFGENIGMLRDGKTISVERRSEIVSSDTIFYQFGQLRQQEYQLEFTAENVANPALTAILEDAYLQSSTAIALDAVTNVSFMVNADPASKAADRFRLVFRQLGPVPVSFSSISAERQDKNILVSWKVENELNIHHYVIERSANGRTFNEIGTKVAVGTGNGASLYYSWLDQQTLTGNNFYRIKSVGNNGETKLSEIVKVNMADEPSSITVFPNPVKEDGVISLSMVNEPEGTYKVNLVNARGQVILRRTINHVGGNTVYTIKLNNTIAHGNYVLQVSEGNKVKSTFKILY